MNKQKERRLLDRIERLELELKLIYNKFGVFIANDQNTKKPKICYTINSIIKDP